MRFFIAAKGRFLSFTSKFLNDTTMSSSETSEGKIWTGPEAGDLEALVRPWKSLGHYFMHKLAGDNAQATIFTDYASGRKWTGAQFREKVLAVASALVDEHNFQPGTMVCLSYDNTDHIVILSVAIIVAGGSIATCFHKDPYPELLYLAKKVEPKFLFCHSRNRNWAQQLERDLGFPVSAISMDDNEPSSAHSFAHLMAYDYTKPSSAHSRNLLPVACRRDLTEEVALVTMSSGTTGKPKAVTQSHWNCLADLLSQRSSTTRSFNFSFACCASLDYVSGRLILFGAIHRGYNAVILNDFEPKEFLRALEEYKVSLIYLGAASFYNLITHPLVDKHDLSSLRVVFPMGAKVTYQKELGEFFAKHPNIVEVRQGYGASEFGGAALKFSSPKQYLEDANNCGHLFPGFKAKIVDPATGKLLGPNEQGLIHLRGPTVFPGYYDMEQARALARGDAKQAKANGEPLSPFIWDSCVFDDDGFYITGDLAFFNDKEELFIVGRQKELMSCRGAKKVLPQELEEVVQRHPAVMKVCVLGMPNKREPGLQCPRAFVVLKQDYYDEARRHVLELKPKFDIRNKELEQDLKREKLVHAGEHTLSRISSSWRHTLAEDVMAFVNERVGWDKHLTGGIVILDDIPTSRTTGKVDKNYLRSLGLDRIEIYGDRSC